MSEQKTKIELKNLQLVPISEIKPNPKNRNKHSREQIERFSKIIQASGFRTALIVSNQSGLLVSGHGRLLAAKKLGLKELPVSYQDFATPEIEYAHAIADNEIAKWAEIDLSGIHVDLPDMGPFDTELLGLKSFKFEPTLDPGEQTPELKLIECPDCGHQFESKQAKSKKI